MRFKIIAALVVLLLTVLCFSSSSFALCSDPEGGGGDMIYNSDHGVMQYCNDTDWISFPKGDRTPDAFTFTALTNQTPSTLVTSNTVTINGLGGSAPVTISGAGTPQFRINGGSWVTSGTISNGQTLQLRLTSGISGTTTTASVVVGNAAPVTWDVGTSGADTTPNAFDFTDIYGAALNTVTSSATLTISGINASTPVSITGTGTPQFRINGGSWVTSGNITNGQTLQLRLTSGASQGIVRTATVTVGSVTDEWNVGTSKSLTLVAQAANSDTVGLAIPTVQSGDLIVFVMRSNQVPTTPSGFTVTKADENISGGNNGFWVFTKIANGTEGGTAVGAGGTTFTDRVITVYRPSAPISTVTIQDYEMDYTAPSADVGPIIINASTGALPLIVYGYARNTQSTNTFTTASPAFTTEIVPGANVGARHGLRIYNSTPSDHTIDTPLRGTTYNMLTGFYLEVN